MDPVTLALHIKTELGDTLPATTPIFQSSAFQAASPYFYTRKANPNSSEYERVVCELEGCAYGVSTTTGMTAIAICLDLLRPGDTLVINNLIYGCSFKAFHHLGERRGFDVLVLDLSDPANWAKIPAKTRMVFFETPTNPFLRSVGIRALSDHLKSAGIDAYVVVDNTWATPLFQKPLQHGAHISLHSATKYFSGHSDVMGGIVLTDDPQIHRELMELRFFGGYILPPMSAWLLRRSLQTLSLRLKHQQEVTRRMRDFLRGLPEIREVYYPDVDGEQLTGYGGILFFELAAPHQGRYERFRDALKLFDTGTGMACVTSMVAQPYSGSHASMNDAEKAGMGIGRDLVRLCFGLEEPADLEADIRAALAEMARDDAPGDGAAQR